MSEEIRRIGILTGGGDCPGLNAVIRAVYRAATLQYRWEVFGIENGFEGLIEPEARRPHGNRLLTEAEIGGILPRGGTLLGASNRGNPFRYPQPVAGAGQPAEPVEIDCSDAVVRNIRDLGLDALVCVGGDGTMEIAHRLAGKGVPVVGVPKTIDNDLSATDYTFGFATAVDTAVEAIDKLHSTAESHGRVMFIEVMGRNTGWIALHAGLAGGADVILIPEIPYAHEAICRKIDRRKAAGRHFAIVVVAEGARPEGGAASYLSGKAVGRERRLGGAAERVATAIAPHIGLEHRVTVLGHLQRGGSPNSFDRLLATHFGTAAVELIAGRRFDHIACLRAGALVAVPIAEAIASTKAVDRREQLLGAARAIGISFGEPEG